jgi:hypothetical protein
LFIPRLLCHVLSDGAVPPARFRRAPGLGAAARAFRLQGLDDSLMGGKVGRQPPDGVHEGDAPVREWAPHMHESAIGEADRATM